MKLSIIVPAHNEEGRIVSTLNNIIMRLSKEDIPFEIVVVNDHSTDNTARLLDELARRHETIKVVGNSSTSKGYGLAVQEGLRHSSGDAVVIVMADGSDDPDDIVKYYRKLQEGYDCVFGSRFVKGSRLVDYPVHKLILNRLGNWFVMFLFGIKHNDISNGFKCYRREVIQGLKPILSHHFNLTVELPLKAIVRGYTYATAPISWYNRTTGVSKWKIKEMGSRYMFIVLYIFLEKHLSKGDYIKKNKEDN